MRNVTSVRDDRRGARPVGTAADGAGCPAGARHGARACGPAGVVRPFDDLGQG